MATRIPINKESGGIGFEDRQKRIWDDMETDMDRRRREWEDEIDKMRKEFFLLRPEGEGRGGGVGGVAGGGGPSLPRGLGERMVPRSRLLETTSSSSSGADDSRGVVVKDDKGNPVFKVLFDVHDYKPEEVSVKMDANKIMVSARHEAQQGGSSLSREYSRQVNIPPNIDPITLQCSMGPDGILAVEAPLPAPSYSAIRDAAATATSLPVRTGSPGASSASTSTTRQPSSSSSSTSSTSYQTSYSPQRVAAEPALPSGFKPVSAPLQNAAAPPPAPAGSSQQASSSSSHSTLRDSSGFAKASPPFQAMSQPAPAYSPPLKGSSGVVSGSGSGTGRIGSPVVVSDAGRFKLEIDIEDFKPEELTVKTQDKRVVVCARREEKVGNRSSTRELSREYTIPDTVDPLTIKAFFTDGGQLIIEAPYREAGSQAQITSR